LVQTEWQHCFNFTNAQRQHCFNFTNAQLTNELFRFFLEGVALSSVDLMWMDYPCESFVGAQGSDSPHWSAACQSRSIACCNLTCLLRSGSSQGSSKN
jgi:hypothetical protein